jgi:hypothetical protein
MSRTARTIASATILAGTLDIIFAFVNADRTPAEVLRSVASGPFGSGMHDGGWTASLIGLAVHFGIMSVMAAVFVLAARRWPQVLRRPLVSGILYGLLLYVVMYWVVLPLRWPEVFPISDGVEIAKGLFAHVVLVGVPIALVAARLTPRPGFR